MILCMRFDTKQAINDGQGMNEELKATLQGIANMTDDGHIIEMVAHCLSLVDEWISVEDKFPENEADQGVI